MRTRGFTARKTFAWAALGAMAILGRGAFAVQPKWLTPLATCAWNMAGMSEKTDVFMTAPKEKSFADDRKTTDDYFGKGAAFFVGYRAGKAGLWIVNEAHSYFVNLENKMTNSHGMIGLAVKLPDKGPIDIAFGRMDLNGTGRRIWTAVVSAPVKDPSRPALEAQEAFDDELKDQLLAGIRGAVARHTEIYRPPTDEEKRIRGNMKKMLEELLALRRQLTGRQDPPDLSPKVKEALLDDRNNRLLEAVDNCRSTIKNLHEFGELDGELNILRAYIRGKADPSRPERQLPAERAI